MSTSSDLRRLTKSFNNQKLLDIIEIRKRVQIETAKKEYKLTNNGEKKTGVEN